MLREAIAHRIALLRKQKGLSQDELAAKSGLDRTYISGIERVNRNLTLDSLEKVIEALDMHPKEFFKNLFTENK